MEIKDLPPGYLEASKAQKQIELTPEELPWLKERIKVNLTRVMLDNGHSFLLGSAIRNQQLRKLAEGIDKHGPGAREQSDRAFYCQVCDFVKGHDIDSPKLRHPKCRESIFYAKNGGQTRTYFISRRVENEQVIIRIAACYKTEERKVLAIIANA